LKTLNRLKNWPKRGWGRTKQTKECNAGISPSRKGLKIKGKGKRNSKEGGKEETSFSKARYPRKSEKKMKWVSEKT